LTRNDKIVLILAVTGGAALFWGGWECHNRKVIKSTGTVVTVTKDSIVYQDRPVPYRVDSVVYVKGKDGKPYPMWDTLWGVPEVIIEPVDTAAILKRFNSIAYYKDVRDTGRASITILDTVTQNRIQGRSVKVVFSDTAKVTTIVKTLPRKIVAYLTGSVMGNFKNPLFGTGMGFGLKLPNDMTYQGEVKLVNGSRPMGEIRVMFPIRIKPK
jgi:hypothetical protein